MRRHAPTLLLGLLALIGLAVAVLRYARGLGAISNLSDGRPWGLWVSLDLFCGVALAAGGFTLAAAFHILGRRRYRPLVRPAVLTALLGYLMVILALLVDLGQPWRIWHIAVFWNVSSPLFEVGWCVLLYTVILALELSPALFERLGREAPLRAIRRIQLPLVATGVVLSVLHQSSLGSTLLAMPESIAALWFTPILPLLFLLSAVAAGLGMVILESGRRVDAAVLEELGRALRWLLTLYLAVRAGELLLARKLDLVLSSGSLSALFLIEILGGTVAPLLLLRRHASRSRSPTRIQIQIRSRIRSRRALAWAASLVIAGVVLNRFNATLVALAPRPGTSYFPHPLELAISIGIIAAGLLGYRYAARHLPLETA